MHAHGILFHLIVAFAAAQETSISTTTVYATSSNSGACDNFVGACVVYGSYGNNAPYTTTVYAGSAQTTSVATITTPATTQVTATTTVTDSGACNGYVGACVVYGADTTGPTTTTATQVHDGDGEIGQQNSGDGYIGAAQRVGLDEWRVILLPCLALLLPLLCGIVAIR